MSRPPITNYEAALELLRRSLNSSSATFRSGQWEAISALTNDRKRLLIVERTGWGKSSVYFIATRILRDRGYGPTLIVSPLLALMRNQLVAAKRLGIVAKSINSTNKDQWPSITAAVHANCVDALLISPERLANDEFVENVLWPISQSIGLFVVDEAHCISDWGHDFRPDYRRLLNVVRRMPSTIPIVGTTATANDRVVNDVRTQLGNVGIQRGSLMRESLALQTIRLPSQAARLAWLKNHIDKLPGTGIIYTLTKRDARQVAAWLTQNDISAEAYYSDVLRLGYEDSNQLREHLEDLLLNNKLKTLVATTALGMGYDKPDLGFVLHYQAPGSIVSYYQQVGRAGRAINRAVGILLTGFEDAEIHAFFRRSAFPPEEWVNAILNALHMSDGLSVRQLEKAVNLRQGQISKVLKYLSVDNPAPVIKEGSKWARTPVNFRMDHERIQRLTRQREFEWNEVNEFIDSTNCLMEHLARALDDTYPEPCGKCAQCLNEPLIPPVYDHSTATEAARFIRHAEMPLNCNKQVAKDAFVLYRFSGNLPRELQAEEGRILSRWRDPGWGHVVAEDKQNGFFRDELVDAAAEMIRQRWHPSPPPCWVTCIPSNRHPSLVPNFAKRLANKLGLRFSPVVVKVRDNQPQKLQQNRFHQCQNLDGVFAIVGPISSSPVLLVDDVVDSKWTLSVVAALLLHKGSGPVLPLALANSSMGA